MTSYESNDNFLEIDFQPDIQALLSYKTQGYKEWWALAEFVDNSISSFVLNRQSLIDVEGAEFKLSVDVEINERDGFILIKDNAAGISDADMKRAFTSGVPPADKTSLSQFGLGMKAAGIWFADVVTVRTTALGEAKLKEVVIDLQEIISTRNTRQVPIETPTIPDAHGTEVRLSNLTRDFPTDKYTVGNVYDYLSSIYRDFLLSGEVHITLTVVRKNNHSDVRELTFQAPEVLVAPRAPDIGVNPGSDAEIIEWRKDIEFTTSAGRRVTGWAGLRAKGSYGNNGLVLLWHRKVIIGANVAADVRSGDSVYRPHLIFGAQNSAASLRLFAQLDMSSFSTTNRKDDLTWSAAEEQEFLQLLKAELNREPVPLITQAYKYKVSEQSKDVVEVWKSNIQEVASYSESILLDISEEIERIELDSKTTEEIDTGLDESRHLIAEYTVTLRSGLPVKVTLGFVSVPGESTFLLESSDEGDFVLINRESNFAKTFGDPRLNDLTAFTRVIVSLGLAEVAARKVSGARMLGTLRRLFNYVLDSNAMTTVQLPADTK